MSKTRINLGLAILFTVSLLIVMTGCSTEQGNPMASSPAQQETVTDVKASPYPALTADEVEQLVPGLQVLPMNGGRANQLDDQASAFIRYQVGGTVSHRNCGVEIGPWLLRSDQTVTVSTPVPGSAIVDYYPHPYRFNGCVRIWIDLRTIQLPAGRRWDELQFWYQNEDGTMTRYWGVIDLNRMTYSAWPDHFSRYILGLPAASSVNN
jgi:hypothetical protein